MVQKVQVTLVDDVDGSPAAESIKFGLDGVAYEIDLNEEHANALRESLAEWIGHARRAPARRGAGRRSATTDRAGGSGRNAAEVREWARANGYEVSERGRISAEVRAAYEAAH